MDYLTTLYARGLKYDSINTAKSAISAIVKPSNSVTLGNQPLISRFMKGVFRSRPPVPRYESTWDVHIVLSHLGSFAVASELNLKDLTLTLVMLMALVSAQRTQSLYLLDLNFMKHGTDMIQFAFPAHIKQSRQGYKNPTLQLKAYPADPKLCVVTHLQEYLSRTQKLRGSETQLFVSYVKPHRGVTKDTIARWIRTVMLEAGLHVETFRPHSTRSAATSKAKQACVPIQDILKHAGWSNERTFDRFYNKPVVTQDNKFAESVLH